MKNDIALIADIKNPGKVVIQHLLRKIFGSYK